MRALISNRNNIATPNLKSWLRHGDPAFNQLMSGTTLDSSLAVHNQLSQLNVLLQIEHVKSYPPVQKRIKEGTLAVHGWWFDIAKADVYTYEPELKRFVLIDEETADRLLLRLQF